MNASTKHLDIRKYPNRRYYDSTHSRHLTLEEIRSLIRDGYDLKVTDSKTGADITAQVLAQIILDLDAAKIQSFPVTLLLRMIRTNDELVRDFMEKYFNQAFGAYLEYQRQMEARLRQMQALPGPLSPLAWSQAMLMPFSKGFSGGESEEPSTPQAPTPPAIKAEEVKQMRDLIAELQEQVAGLKHKPKGKRNRFKR